MNATLNALLYKLAVLKLQINQITASNTRRLLEEIIKMQTIISNSAALKNLVPVTSA